MIKFLHTADLHLDSPFAALRPEQAVARRQEQRELVGRICAICRENACDLLLLPGDLFDGSGVYLDTLDVLRDELCECGAQVFIAPGNHDFLTPASPYLTQAWPENVHIFAQPRIEPIVLRESGCVVWGAGFTSPIMPGLLGGFRMPEEYQDYVNLMVLHGDALQADSPYSPVSKADIEQSGLDYLALGHTHARSELLRAGDTPYAWPGCPMGRGFDECGEKGVYIGTVEENVSLRFVPLDVRRYECLELDAGSDLSEALPEHTENDIYRITLTGESEGVDLAALHRALDGRFYALELRDATVPPLELWTRCGETTLEGMSLHTLRRTLDRCETDAQRRRVELAARRIVEVCEGREAPAL